LWKLETWKLGLSRQASQSFQNEFPALDTGIAQNSKTESHSGNLAKTEPKGRHDSTETALRVRWPPSWTIIVIRLHKNQKRLGSSNVCHE
jgi:hypothetical protein